MRQKHTWHGKYSKGGVDPSMPNVLSAKAEQTQASTPDSLERRNMKQEKMQTKKEGGGNLKNEENTAKNEYEV